jgi:predicted lipoprotein with Yx(FWY)xxD motif
MPRSNPLQLLRLAIGLALALAAVWALLGTGGVGAQQQARKHIVKKAPNKTLGRYVLTNTRHHTLYSLSAEKNGRIICDDACLDSWSTLAIPPATKPVGPVKLGVISRPGGGLQVTYKGLPLYTFRADRISGSVKGEGIKDVGTWHAVTIGKPLPPEPAPAPTPQPEPPNPYPY